MTMRNVVEKSERESRRPVGLVFAFASMAATIMVIAMLVYFGWLPALLTLIAVTLAFAVAVSSLAERWQPAGDAQSRQQAPSFLDRVLARVRLH